MSIFPDSPALFAAGGCGSHQQVYGVINVGGGEVEPLIFLDFKNGIYTVDGDLVVLGDVAGDPGEGFGDFDPAGIVGGVGFRPVEALTGSNTVALLGAASALVLGGSTTIYRAAGFTNSADPGVAGEVFVEMRDEDYNTYYAAKLTALTISSGCKLEDNSGDQTVSPLATGTHKAAITMIDGKMAMSIDGGAVLLYDPADPWTVAPTFYVISVGGPWETAFALESIGIYPPQVDADLPALSALS